MNCINNRRRWLCRKSYNIDLLKKNFKVLVLILLLIVKKISWIHLIKYLIEFLKANLTLIKGDLRHKENLLDLFMPIYAKGKEIDFVIHCAGLKSVKKE